MGRKAEKGKITDGQSKPRMAKRESVHQDDEQWWRCGRVGWLAGRLLAGGVMDTERSGSGRGRRVESRRSEMGNDCETWAGIGSSVVNGRCWAARKEKGGATIVTVFALDHSGLFARDWWLALAWPCCSLQLEAA